MKLLTVVGARPQFIKAAVVSRALKMHDGIAETIVHTGQHYDDSMSRIFFEELDIPPPAQHLGIGSGAHGAQTGRMLEAVEQVLLDEKPDWTLVYGDTNSTLAGALAAAKLRIPVAHVEAGLRCFNRDVPEEINRVAVDHVADLCFAPTNAAVANLRREGIGAERIEATGDVMYDAATLYGPLAERKSRVLARLGLAPRSYVLATVHRAENADDPERLGHIFAGLQSVARSRRIVLPLHPRVRAILERDPGLARLAGALTVEPVGYLDMLVLEKNAAAIATDSGGVQKEAFFARVPCVTLRSETEWVELVESGWSRLTPPTSAEAIADAIHEAIRRGGGADGSFYGDGGASEQIASRLAVDAP
jgi:UDP-GlcNAc3NAcA epimerase